MVRNLCVVELVCALGAQAQLLNNWTNPVSARWESPSWSLGILPAADQTVNITNPGYKAVDIDSMTFADFPDSLTVSNLTVSAPTNALSTLLLNYAGTAAPLKVLNQCVIATNGTLDNFGSSFEVDCVNGGELLVDGGTLAEDGGFTVVNGPVSVINNGSFYATNANVTLGAVTIGAAPASVGTFIQNGGSIAAQQINVASFTFDPFGSGGYELLSGVLYAINGTQCSAAGPGFRQFGGTNYGNITVTQGYYDLRSGMAKGNTLTAGGTDGNSTLFYQEGGLLDMQFINVTAGSNWPPQLGPWFAGGTVHCGTLNIGGNARVELRGADFFVTNNFDLRGMYFVVPRGPLIERAACELWAGSLHLPSMSLGQLAFFDQMGGSNEISGGLSVVTGQYSLYGGTLETSTSAVASATFAQGGGQHLVHGVLSIAGTGAYSLTAGTTDGGGNLVCQGVYLRGQLTMTMTFNGLDFNPAATFTNTGLFDLGGTLATELPDAEAGQVQLASNSIIAFSNGFPAVVRFANSSAVAWTPGALLLITNWSGSDHVFAGTDATGLSSAQLQQVEFANPAGSPAGTYPAQILSTGEIVPVQPPALNVARIPGALVLSWPGGYRLLSATNLAGPYQPISGASSPWTNFFTQPREFFVLSPPSP